MCVRACDKVYYYIKVIGRLGVLIFFGTRFLVFFFFYKTREIGHRTYTNVITTFHRSYRPGIERCSFTILDDPLQPQTPVNPYSSYIAHH